MHVSPVHRAAVALACVTLLAAPARAQKITEPKQGKGGSVVQGAAGTDGSERRQRARALRQADGRDGRRRAAERIPDGAAGATTCSRRSA